MASPLEQAPTMVLSSEDKAILEEMMKELDSMAKEEAVVTAVIRNQTLQTLELKYNNEYSGHYTTPGPDPVLEVHAFTKFIHEGVTSEGSKVGVAYFANGHQWIMAWSVPLQSTVTKPAWNKIYVEDGPEATIDWALIEKKLDVAGDICVSPGAKAIIGQGSNVRLATVFVEPRPRN